MKKGLVTLCSIMFLLASCQEKLSFEGYVKDAQTGKPLEDAEVAVIMKTKQIITTETNSDGYYRITFPCTDSIILFCRLPRYISNRQYIIINEEKYRQNNNIKSPDILLKVQKNRIYCSGKVIDEYGKPIKNVEVIRITNDAMFQVAKTSEKGIYNLIFHSGNELVKHIFMKKGYSSDTIKIMLDSLGTTVYAPDVILKKK